MASIGITAPLPFPRYPSPVLTPAGGGLLYSRSWWYIGGPTYSFRLPAVITTCTESGMCIGGRAVVVGEPSAAVVVLVMTASGTVSGWGGDAGSAGIVGSFGGGTPPTVGA